MSLANEKSGAHSAIVRMELCVNGATYPIAQLGGDFLVLETPIDHPPVEAEISVWIDDHLDRWRVRLAEGIKVTERKTRISRSQSGSTVR